MDLQRDMVRSLLSNGNRKTTEDEITRFIEEAKAGVPVMPVTFFCQFLKEWANLYGAPAEENYPGQNKKREEFTNQARNVFLQIQKSNFLWRRIYGGEETRTEICPIHRGHWSGCNTPDNVPCGGACMYGNNVTGWLPKKPE